MELAEQYEIHVEKDQQDREGASQVADLHFLRHAPRNAFGAGLYKISNSIIGFINRSPTEWSQRSQASAIMGSSEVSSSFDMFNVRSRCCLSNGAQENDNKSVEANV